MTILWTALCYLCGSLMFSYWLGLMSHHNLSQVGDGNPGALNLWRAAGFVYGLSGIALDFLKGYLPVFLLLHAHLIEGYAIIPVAAAPILGHACSPWMRGRGGKAIAVTFGVWSGLTGFKASLAYAIILAVLLAFSRLLNRGKRTSTQADALQVVFGMLLLLFYLLGQQESRPILGFWLINLLLLALTHRRELRYLFGRLAVERGRQVPK